MIDVSGISYNSLTAIQPTDRRKNRSVVWQFRCVCGNTVDLPVNTVKSGQTKSCGCLSVQAWAKNGKANGRLNGLKSKGVIRIVNAPYNELYGQYKRKALKRNYVFELSLDEFMEIINKPCHYCGTAKSNTWRYNKGSVTIEYNGIDRKDNSKGYIIGNVVSCCGTCNRMKMDMDYESFIKHCKRIAKLSDDYVELEDIS